MKRALLIPVGLVLGPVAFVVVLASLFASIPFIVAAVGLSAIGLRREGDWIFDHAPIELVWETGGWLERHVWRR